MAEATTAEAIRKALTALGVEAERSEINAWVKQHYNGIETGAPAFASTLSNQRKKMREGGSAPATGKGGRGKKASGPELPGLDGTAPAPTRRIDPETGADLDRVEWLMTMSYPE